MSDRDDILALVDELRKLLDGSPAASIEVETSAFAVKVTRSSEAPSSAGLVAHVRERDAVAEREPLQRVHATTVGIFFQAKAWQKGDPVDPGTVLGAIQSLGHMADITAPAAGRIEEVLVAAGAPVEYGQALFAISLA